MKTSAKKRRLVLGAALASVGIVLGTALPAAAATYNISATLNCAGALFQSDNFRPHTNNAGASLRLTANDWWYDVWTLRTGLRNTSGTQVTAALETAPTNRSTNSYRTSGGSTSIPGASLAVNARVGGTENTSGCRVFPPTFSGVLTQ